jgi:hypothetical protein
MFADQGRRSTMNLASLLVTEFSLSSFLEYVLALCIKLQLEVEFIIYYVTQVETLNI